MAADIIEDYGDTVASVDKCFDEEVWDEVLPGVVDKPYAELAKSRELYRIAAGQDVAERWHTRKRYRVIFNAQSEVVRLEAEEPQAKVADADTEREFRAHADKWLRETGHLSDPIKKIVHPSHFKIIGMGEKVLPLILREVQKNSGHWFVALEAISPENPVNPEDETSLQRVANAWLEWGKERGFI